MNPDLLRARGLVLHALRTWFADHGYLEVQTPVLVPAAAMETNLEPVPVGDAWLHTSPEFAMKRVLAAGLPRIYQVVPCFRQEEVGDHHSQEFTLLEWYRVGAGTAELMDEVEDLLSAAAAAVGHPPLVWRRRLVSDLLPDTGDPDTWFHTWVDAVEPTLTEPSIVHGYPAWQCALARLRGNLADRFEVYLGGVELANAFAEELDPRELVRRMDKADAERRAAGRAPHPRDERFLQAVGRMPRCAGIAMGIDRLVMALMGASQISQVQVS